MRWVAGSGIVAKVGRANNKKRECCTWRGPSLFVELHVVLLVDADLGRLTGSRGFKGRSERNVAVAVKSIIMCIAMCSIECIPIAMVRKENALSSGSGKVGVSVA